MLDISVNAVLPIKIVDRMARETLGNDTSGVSVDENTWIHLLDDSQANQDIANDVLNNFGDLLVNADKTVMIEGDTNPVITCDDSAIGSDIDLGYLVLLDGEVYAVGTTLVTAGEAILNLVSPGEGVYELFMYRTVGNYASGSVTITVSEV